MKMDMRTRYVPVVCGILLCFIAIAAAPTAGASDGESFATTTDEVEPDEVVLDVTLEPDGDAHWRISYRTRLADDATAAAFDERKAAIEQDPAAYTDRFERRMTATADRAAAATDREMEIDDVSVTAETRHLPREYGVVTYRFTWRGFTAVEGEELRAGDAIAGLFLDADTRLVMRWPDDLQVTVVDPEPDDEREREVVWRGPKEFGADGPRVVVAPTGGVGLWPVGLLVLLAAGGVGWWMRSGRADDGSPATDGRNEALLSNEERMMALLEDHDDRIKQREIARRLDWTDAKTSKVVRSLSDEGAVEVFRLGRENVVVLPDGDI